MISLHSAGKNVNFTVPSLSFAHMSVRTYSERGQLSVFLAIYKRRDLILGSNRPISLPTTPLKNSVPNFKPLDLFIVVYIPLKNLVYDNIEI